MNTATAIRPPAVAGMFYPGDPDTLRDEGGYITARVELLDEDEDDLRHLTKLRATIEYNFDHYFGELAEITGTKLDQINRVAAIHKLIVNAVRLVGKDLDLTICQIILRQLHYLLKKQ